MSIFLPLPFQSLPPILIIYLCSSFFFKDYQTKIEYATGLLTPGSAGINHAVSQDGKVALLTVKLLSAKDKSDLANNKKAAKFPNKKRFSLSVLEKKGVAAA